MLVLRGLFKVSLAISVHVWSLKTSVELRSNEIPKRKQHPQNLVLGRPVHPAHIAFLRNPHPSLGLRGDVYPITSQLLQGSFSTHFGTRVCTGHVLAISGSTLGIARRGNISGSVFEAFVRPPPGFSTSPLLTPPWFCGAFSGCLNTTRALERFEDRGSADAQSHIGLLLEATTTTFSSGTKLCLALCSLGALALFAMLHRWRSRSGFRESQPFLLAKHPKLHATLLSTLLLDVKQLPHQSKPHRESRHSFI
jgi:hypothetical protein